MIKRRSVQCVFGLCLVVWCFCPDCIAADSTFGIDSYKPERFSDFQWIVDIDFRADGYREEKVSEDVVSHRHVEETRSVDWQRIRFTSAMDYFKETKKRFVYWSLSGKYSLYNCNPSSARSGDRTFKPGLFTRVDFGSYAVGDWYLSLEGQTHWIYAHNLHDVNPDTHYREYGVAGSVMPGWGRIYAGKYAATAQYIINELDDKGLMIRRPGSGEMKYLADIIYKCRNRFIIDFRLHKIESLKSIIGYIERAGIIEDTGPYGYLLIQDVWDYFPKDPRFFGIRLAAGIGYSFVYVTTQTTDESDIGEDEYRHSYYHTEREVQSPYLQAHVQYHRPLSWRWQIDFDGRWKYFLKDYIKDKSHKYFYSGHSRDFTTEGYHKDNNLIQDMDASAAITYLFDSRTIMSLSGNVTYLYRKEYEERYTITRDNLSASSRKNIQEDLSLRLSADIIYRISIPTSLTVTISMYRNAQNRHIADNRMYSERDVRLYNLSARLVHFLF